MTDNMADSHGGENSTATDRADHPGTIRHDPADGVEGAVWTLLDVIDVAAGHEGVDPEMARGYYRLAADYAEDITRTVRTGGDS